MRFESPAGAAPLLMLAVVVPALWGCGSCEGESARSETDPTTAGLTPPGPVTEWQRLDPEAAPGALGLDLVATNDGVIATWLEPHLDGFRQRFARLQGEAWTAPTTVVEAPDLVANWADFPGAMAGGDGAIYVHHLKRSGESPYAYEIRLARTRDLGASFEALGVVHRDGTPTEHGFVSMVPTAEGIRLFWLDGRASVEEGGATAVYSAAVGEEIGTATRIDERVCDCCQTDAALTDDGPIVVFRDREDEAEVRDISIIRSVAEGRSTGTERASFTETQPVHRDGWEIAGCPVNGPAVDADGQRVAVAWFTGADGGAVRFGWSLDGGATFGAPIDIDPNQPPGRVDVALTDDGAAVSWLARAAGGGAEIRVRRIGLDGNLGAPIVVASTGTERASGFPIMVRDGDRLLVGHRDDGEPSRVHVSALPVAELPTEAATADDTPRPAVLAPGDAMPASLVRGRSEEPLELSSAGRERPLVVAFYASWCQPCRDELRAVEAVRARLGGDDRVAFVAVSIDEGSLDRAEGVVRRWGYEGPVMRDVDSAEAFGVPPIPGLFVFDSNHILRFSSVGQRVTQQQIEDALDAASSAMPTVGP